MKKVSILCIFKFIIKINNFTLSEKIFTCHTKQKNNNQKNNIQFLFSYYALYVCILLIINVKLNLV